MQITLQEGQTHCGHKAKQFDHASQKKEQIIYIMTLPHMCRHSWTYKTKIYQNILCNCYVTSVKEHIFISTYLFQLWSTQDSSEMHSRYDQMVYPTSSLPLREEMHILQNLRQWLHFIRDISNVINKSCCSNDFLHPI